MKGAPTLHLSPSRLATLVAVVALHLGVIGWLGWAAVPNLSEDPTSAPFVIELQPRRALRQGAALQTPAAEDGKPAAPQPAPLRPHEAGPAAPALARPTEATPRGSAAAAPPPSAASDGAAIAQALRNSALGCRLGGLSPREQERCDRRMAEAAARAAPVQGTGRPSRDARSAAQGAEAFARYEDKRRGLRPYSRAEACPGSPYPSDPCAVAIQGRIWSSRDGWLPDLPRPH